MATAQARGPGGSRSRPRGRRGPTEFTSGDIGRAGRWVRVTCPDCGVVRVRSDRVVVRQCLDDQTWSYRARCSKCDVVFVDGTPEALALPALAEGVAVECWTLPRPSPRHDGPPLRALDAVELHLALAEPGWFDRFVQVEPGA